MSGASTGSTWAALLTQSRQRSGSTKRAKTQRRRLREQGLLLDRPPHTLVDEIEAYVHDVLGVAEYKRVMELACELARQALLRPGLEVGAAELKDRLENPNAYVGEPVPDMTQERLMALLGLEKHIEGNDDQDS